MFQRGTLFEKGPKEREHRERLEKEEAPGGTRTQVVQPAVAHHAKDALELALVDALKPIPPRRAPLFDGAVLQPAANEGRGPVARVVEGVVQVEEGADDSWDADEGGRLCEGLFELCDDEPSWVGRGVEERVALRRLRRRGSSWWKRRVRGQGMGEAGLEPRRRVTQRSGSEQGHERRGGRWGRRRQPPRHVLEERRDRLGRECGHP